MLDIASGTIRNEAGQQLELVEDDEVTLPGVWERVLWLPQRPVVEVSAISINDFALPPGTWVVRSSGQLMPFFAPLLNWSDADGWWGGPGGSNSWWGGPAATVAVTYTHGYDPIPDDLRGVCLALAQRLLLLPLSGAVVSESIADYSITYGRLATNQLMADERRTVRRYRRRNATSLTGAAA
jgi:hypothetical protein